MNGKLVLLIFALTACTQVFALTEIYEFPYDVEFGTSPTVRIGAEGMASTRGTGSIPRLFVLSHSMTYKTGVINELKLTANGGAGTGTILNTIHLDNTTLPEGYLGADFTDISFNLEGNLVVLGRQITPDGVEEGVLYTFSIEPLHFGDRVGGPIHILPPVSIPTGISFDHNSKNYWLVDRDTNSLYEEVLTCCEERNYGPLKRWEQQLRMRRIWGLEYGLLGYDNIFVKREVASKGLKDEHKDHDDDRKSNAYIPRGDVLRWISAPAFGDPEGVDVDPITGNLWVLNDAPTTVLYLMTTDGVVLRFWQIEQLTGGYQDANSLAVTCDWVIIGFDDDRRIVVFKKEDRDEDK